MTRFWFSAVLLLLTAAPAVAASVEVVDGDTIRIDGERVRLWGFDAPEKRQECSINGVEQPIGEEATNRLRSILAGGELRCATQDHDRYGRTVAQCWAGRVDIGQEMVRSGWAWALPRYSKRLYLPAQEEAERENRGVWAGRGHCEAPARYRQSHRR
jgi:endonuclease YncB( thermonuclease family)